MSTPEREPLERDRPAMASEISREIVRLHARSFGRGPTRANTFIYDDFALCILEDVLTRAEKTLVGAGNTEQVHSTRRAFNSAVEHEFISIVETATGREVRAFISQICTNPELATELFLFHPGGVSGAHESPIDTEE